MNPFSLENKTILITGASSGIGRSIAIECSKMGARIIIVGRNSERLSETYNMLCGNEHIQIVADIDKQEDIDALVTEIPVIDGLVNNAGISHTKPITFLKDDEVINLFQTNFFSQVRLTKTLMKKKKINNGSSIVFMSSMAALNPEFGNSIYGASKAALKTFMLSCAKEFAPKLIRANAIHPGMVKTPLVEALNFDEETIAKDEQRYPLKRYGNPEDIAYATIYLLSDASSWVTGTSIMVNGGIHLV